MNKNILMIALLCCILIFLISCGNATRVIIADEEFETETIKVVKGSVRIATDCEGNKLIGFTAEDWP